MPAVDAVPVNGAWTPAAARDLETLCANLRCRYAVKEPLARHTSMGVGGPCQAMVWPRRAEHVRALTGWMGPRGLAWRVLGSGTNVLARDSGVDEIVLNTGELIEGVAVADDRALLPAGMTMAQALRRTADTGRDGLVWAAGLPGTVGGAAAGNAGCWGSDMASSVAYLDLVDASGNPTRLHGHELAWSYRSLDLPSQITGPATIVAAGVDLQPADSVELRRRYSELQGRKRERQPVGGRSSGCVFRNPEHGELTAGQLLDAAGCKGMRVGAAEVSAVHANFVINRGTARATEVHELIDGMRARVARHSGIELQREIRQW